MHKRATRQPTQQRSNTASKLAKNVLSLFVALVRLVRFRFFSLAFKRSSQRTCKQTVARRPQVEARVQQTSNLVKLDNTCEESDAALQNVLRRQGTQNKEPGRTWTRENRIDNGARSRRTASCHRQGAMSLLSNTVEVKDGQRRQF